MDDDTKKHDNFPEEQGVFRTYVTATNPMQIFEPDKEADGSPEAASARSKTPRKKKTQAPKTSQREAEFASLIAALSTQTDDFIQMNMRVHPRFKTLLQEDAKANKRSMNQQWMIGYLQFRYASRTDMRKRAALLGRLGQWINDHDLPEADKQAFAEILLETQAAFRGE